VIPFLKIQAISKIPGIKKVNLPNHKFTNMRNLHRITFDPNIMGGKPCIRGMRVTVGTIVGLLATGHSKANILKLYPYLETDDIDEALSYAAWRSEEMELPLEVGN
jgi:uncharacterized protein (DUF433 family)